jgi:hypothetical protein
MPERIPQSATIRVPLQAYLSSDHVSPATGKTVAITLSKDGGAYANPSAGATNAVEVANGSYYVDLSTTDTGTLGPLWVRGAEGTIDQVIALYDVVKATTGGLSALPDAAPNASGGLPVVGSAPLSNLDAAVSTRSTYAGGAVASVTGNVGGSVVGAVASVTAPVSILLSQVGLAPRSLDAVNDSALTVGDALVSALCGAAGKEQVSGTSYLVQTPHTGTTIRTFTLDSSTTPTQRS